MKEVLDICWYIYIYNYQFLCSFGRWAPTLLSSHLLEPSLCPPALHRYNLNTCSSAPTSASLSPSFEAWCSRVWKAKSSRQLIAHRVTLGQERTEMWLAFSSLTRCTQDSEAHSTQVAQNYCVVCIFSLFPGSSCPHIKQFTFPNRSPAPKPLTQVLFPGAPGYNLLPFIELFEKLKRQFCFFLQSRHKTLQTVVLVGINQFHSLECIHF